MTTEPTGRPLVNEVGELLRVFRSVHPSVSDAPIYRSYEVARAAHGDQKRRSGEAYITHPLAVAEILASYGMDRDTIVAALLHDTVEDTDLTLSDVEDEFGAVVASLIDGVTKLDRIKFDTREAAQAATIRKMVVAMAQDVRVLLIKLVDRLHNIRTIGPLPPEKQRRVAQETLDVYAPLAHRLGVQEIKHELENRCFEVLYPKRYAEIEDLIEERSPQREAIIDKAIGEVRGMLTDAGISCDVTGRPKHHYSIYKKMIDTGQQFEDIHDLIGIRILVEDLRDCYGALGLIHTLWPPVHGRFKDYIAMPKFNLYQSIHTTVIGPDGKPLEVQIRTREMHERAEYGIAAHWRYKERLGSESLPWMADLRRLQEDYADPEEFLAHLKLDLYQDEVFAVTPAGDVITLPRGATPVDFAYAVHTEVGHRCAGAKVNGRLVNLATELESGDIVEIQTSKAPNAGPSRDWLASVRTSKAKAKIRQWFSKERREAAYADGKDAVYAALRKEGLGLGAAERDRLLLEVADEVSHKSLESLYVSVGEGTVSAASVARRLAKRAGVDLAEDSDDLLSPPRPRSLRSAGTGIIVEGLDDVWVRVAKCCAPVPGDAIVGFVTVGRGVSVHRADCTNLASLTTQLDRMIDVSWSPDRVGSFAVWMQVEALDRPGLLRDVTAQITDVGGNIVASSSATGRDRVAILRYEVELADPTQLAKVQVALRSVDGVYDAFRIVPHGDD